MNKTSKKTSKKETNTKKIIKKTDAEHPINFVIPFALGIFAAFAAVCLVLPNKTGILGSYLSGALTGVFGLGAILFPVLILLLGIFWRKYIGTKALITKCLMGFSLLIFYPMFFSDYRNEYTAKQLFELGKEYSGGGVIGGLLSQFFGNLISFFAPILALIFAICFSLLLFGITPAKAFNFISKKLSEKKVIRSAKSDDNDLGEIVEENEEAEDFEIAVKENKKAKIKYSKAEVEAEAELEDGLSHGNQKSTERKVYDLRPNGAKSESESDDLHKLIDTILDNPEAQPIEEESTELTENFEESKDDSGLTITSTPVGETLESLAPQPEPEYRFPPITLLKRDVQKSASDISAQLSANAEKLMDVLRNFNVKASVVNISCGPAITRYELKPAPGVRVASFTKLVDDIALAFATTGVRIEAPIPGKEAVGIEVPNSDVSIVRVRDLIDSEQFKSSESKLFCALGMDVVGEPVYLDIHKMPHMLIAGATGMGKSVCINSLLTSILYKASPDEVKLILIDPKKVEFVPYNGIPHLLVPVVTDPKKAAGALHWAVNEMERRYDLIESVGVRDIFGYNQAVKNDPEMEKLTQVVIIIDELADLMMTAKNDVEESICRIAQKARAAGMHLIIGTQRPSVNVITGLIKANIPSRIACKTASQIDSRTILDIAGAEKLMGRGDMLYAPASIPKPRRVQGAFVSDSEVEAVTSFIKKNAGKTEYSNDIMSTIEKESQNVSKHVMSDSDDDDYDEMLRPAIEFAFESGKVSTSLFQRKLSIGYGRAAKIIDKMQEMGICSEAEGNKPRTLLMTKQEYIDTYGSLD